jgi:hypothetical protein
MLRLQPGLRTRLKELGARTGALTFSLMWNNGAQVPFVTFCTLFFLLTCLAFSSHFSLFFFSLLSLLSLLALNVSLLLKFCSDFAQLLLKLCSLSPAQLNGLSGACDLDLYVKPP